MSGSGRMDEKIIKKTFNPAYYYAHFPTPSLILLCLELKFNSTLRNPSGSWKEIVMGGLRYSLLCYFLFLFFLF